MRQCQHKGICYIIYIPHRGFWKMIFEAYWPYGQDVIRLILLVYLKGLLILVIVYYGVFPYFFHWVLRSFALYTGITLGFFTGFSKDSPHIFPKRFLEELYIISHLLIFPIEFSRSLTIDYKFMRRSNWSQDHKKKKIDCWWTNKHKIKLIKGEC